MTKEVKKMDAFSYLQKQFLNLNKNLHGLANDLTAEEWVTRPAPGWNLPGYLIWHLPRSHDMFVQTWIRGEPEVAHSEHWNKWKLLRGFGMGAGITLEEADRIAHSVSKEEVLEYADEVCRTITDWLGTGQAAGLNFDRNFDYQQRLVAFPEYQTPGFTSEVKHLFNVPFWELLMRPCTAHVYQHQGEIEVVKEMLRTQK